MAAAAMDSPRSPAGAAADDEVTDRRASSGDKEQLAEALLAWRIGKGEGGEAVVAAERLQRWWRTGRRERQAAGALLGERERLKSAAAVLADHSSQGFEDVLQRIQSKELIASVAFLLAAVDGPGALPSMSRGGLKRSPRAVEAARQQQARKFLTSLMIKHHPEEVIATHTHGGSSEMEEEAAASLDSFEARLLRVAAHLALASSVALIRALDGLEAEAPGARTTFCVRLRAFHMARSFLHESLEALQAIRVSGVAASFLASYGAAYRYLRDAERSQQAPLIAQARQSLGKVRLGITKVLGKDQSERHCSSVERALDAHEPFVILSPGGIRVPLPTMGTPPRRIPPASAAAAALVGLAAAGAEAQEEAFSSDDGRPSGAAGAAAAAPGGGASSSSSSLVGEEPTAGPAAGSDEEEEEVVAVPPSLMGLLRNEHLAHEIILNPDFKLEERRAGEEQQEHGGGPLAQQLKQVRAAMEAMFWERLTLALTPAEQEQDEDFVPGATVQLRFGGRQGSVFLARLEALHPAGEFGREEALVDVRLLADGARERRPLRDLRRRSDPLEFGPLLALVEEVREKLGELTPRRPDLLSELAAKMDTALLGQMAERGVLDAGAICGVLAFAVGQLTRLQAPARAAETAAWFANVEAEVQAVLAVEGNGLGPGFVRLLPAVFKTIFERVDETKRDVANAHVSMLRPFLAQHGVAFERAKFQERLRAGEVQLEHTQAWLRDCLRAPEQRPHLLAAVAQGDAAAHERAVAEALGQLLVRPVRLDNVRAARVPETLWYDGARLAGLRDELDRLALVAVYAALLRQFLGAQRLPLVNRAAVEANGVLAAFEARLYVLLRDDAGAGQVKVPHLVDEASAAAKRVFEAAGASMGSEQGATLRGVLTSAVSFDHPLFALLFGRLAEVLGAFSRGEEAAAGELVGRYGFRPFEPQLAAAGQSLRRVLEHTLAVHGDLYSGILRQEAGALLANGSAAT